MSDIKTTELRLTGPELRSVILALAEHHLWLKRVAWCREGFDTADSIDDEDNRHRWQADYDEAVNETCAEIGTLVIPIGGEL